MPEMKIGSRLIGDGHPAMIIAEVGINHQGDVSIAKKLIDLAFFCKVDAVKFQKRNIDRLLTREGMERPYDNPHSFGATYGEHKLALELGEDDYRELKKYAEERDLIFLASAWDEDSFDFLEGLGVPVMKLPSADLTNTPLVEYAASKKLPLFLSTGMATMDEVRTAVSAARKYDAPLVLMQCTSTYPARFDEANLSVITTFRDEFGCIIGYSGHELGIAVSLGAVALGAAVVERHLTLDRTMKGGDHAASLEGDGLRKLVRNIRAFEKARGDGAKVIYESEIPIRRKLAKSLVARIAIPSGTIITDEMITTKGPGTGIPANRIREIPGSAAARDIAADEVIREEDIHPAV